MGSVTKSELAALLSEISSALNANGDQIADQTAVDCARTLMRIVDPRHNQSAGEQMKGEDAARSLAFSGGSLTGCVEKIKNATIPGRPLSDEFRRDVENHDKTRCVGSLVFEDLWNGFGGWKSPDSFWNLVIYLWKNAPGFFDERYDPERPISENPAVWTQRYFDDQRNYLRHNFCIERLCHLVMVYEYLHGDEAKKRREERRRPMPEVVVQSPSAVNPQRSGRSVWRVMTIIAPVILLLGATVYLLERHNSGARETSTATECDRQRAGVCEAVPPHKHPENDVQLNKELPERTLKSPAAKDASHPMAQTTNTSLHSQGQMNQQMPQGTNTSHRLSDQANRQMPQGTNAEVLLSEQAKTGKRAPVNRSEGSGSR